MKLLEQIEPAIDTLKRFLVVRKDETGPDLDPSSVLRYIQFQSGNTLLSIRFHVANDNGFFICEMTSRPGNCSASEFYKWRRTSGASARATALRCAKRFLGNCRAWSKRP